MSKPKTWKNVSTDNAEKVKLFLISRGGKEDKKIKGVDEKWRVRLNEAVYTYYGKGTLFCNKISSKESEEISNMLEYKYDSSNKEFLIGLDETGKGEILGHCVLAGVLFPSTIVTEIDYSLGSADTKKKKTVTYWDNLFLELDKLKRKGFIFVIEKIPPWHIDKYNVNKIMDVVYQRILSQLIRKVEPNRCKIVLDDYGVGFNLSKYLEFLSKQGAEVRVESKSDDKYIEARLASVIAKREKEKVMEAISKGFSINGCPVGSGNAGDAVTLKWLKKWKETGKPWPWFVKQSYRTIKKTIKKIDPPIRHEILSQDSKKLFDEGKLSIESLSIACPNCGSLIRSAKITPSEKGTIARCPNEECNQVIHNLNTTLLYYYGHIVLDSSVVLSGTVSKDLETKKFFEGFNFVLLPEVRIECDNSGGKKELEKLANFSSIGRINLIDFDTEEIRNGKNLPVDEVIVNSAKRLNAVLYARDRGMYGAAISKGVFCLTK